LGGGWGWLLVRTVLRITVVVYFSISKISIF
jgi:hypothetical protein